jgi:PAS domain S-box-containing protein
VTGGVPGGAAVADAWELGALAEAIVHQGPLATLVLDRDGVIRVANRAAERLLVRPRSALIGVPATSLVPSDRMVDTEQRIVAAANGGGEHLEIDVVTDEGIRPVGMSAAVFEVDGERVGIVLMGRDVRDRKAVEHELAELAASTRALSRSSDVGMYRFGFVPSIHLEDLNPAFEQITGYDREVLMGQPSPLWTDVPPAVTERFVANRFGPASDWPIEWDWRRPDGSVRTISVTEVPLRDEQGRLKATLGICRDMTSERATQRTLQAALDRERDALVRERLALAREREATANLTRVDELRRLFLQAVSHELRTPLTAVTGFASTLRDHLDALDDDQIGHITTRLAAQADRLKDLLDDLLDIERAGRGVAQLDLVCCDIGALVTKLAADHDPAVSVDASPVLAQVDQVKIERIVVNLLGNARRHAGADAVVHAEVRRRGDHVVIVVEDDGPGVDEALRGAVFEPFLQGPAAADAPSPGTGIGLALVAEFARLHGGRATVSDAGLGGARFEVELPVIQAPTVDQGRAVGAQ